MKLIFKFDFFDTCFSENPECDDRNQSLEK